MKFELTQKQSEVKLLPPIRVLLITLSSILISFFYDKGIKTRHTILVKAFDLIYKKGYQTTSRDEVGKPIKQSSFINPLKNSLNPLEEIYLKTKPPQI